MTSTSEAPDSITANTHDTPPADISEWRKTKRQALRAERMALDPDTLERFRERMDRHLEFGFPHLAEGRVAFCWPYQSEYDARPLTERLRARGAITLLPVVVAPRTPLIFREWHPGVHLARGVLGIPFPDTGESLVPDAVLLPMVGYDDAGYRLGYGGGFFDRTLAALPRKPLVIGVVHEFAHLPTIYPQSWDISTDYIVTERGVYQRRHERLEFLGEPGPATSPLASPPCSAAGNV